MKNIAIFASGSGTNAENIANHFSTTPEVHINLILSNRTDAYVLQRAQNLGIKSITFDRTTFYQSQQILQTLREAHTDLIVLAGFMWLVPGYLIEAFPGRILNIHPALLPKFGGKGMYGDHVHRAVIEAHETQSGITIHAIDEQYDQGQHIFQATCPVLPTDTPESLATKVHALEYAHFPRVIAEYLERL